MSEISIWAGWEHDSRITGMRVCRPYRAVRASIWLRKHDPREGIDHGALWEIRDFDRQRQVAGGEARSMGAALTIVREILRLFYAAGLG